MANIVELQNVSKSFGSLKAVDNVSLSVVEGEFITLLGPSGCGKTTTLRMLGGFEFPDNGRIFIDGQDVTDVAPYNRAVNMTFQDYALFPHMTVAQNVGYGLRIARESKDEITKRVGDALDMVDLQDKAENRPSQLSNGQRQRVALARALVRRPKVLLLDEPLSALDLKLREAMQVELKHLHEELGITFIVVTHDQTEALVMSDRVVVMKDGRIVQDGSPTELYEKPSSPYVANFIGTSNLIAGTVNRVDRETIGVNLAAGNISAATNGAVTTQGSKVTVCMRPEKIRLLSGDATPPEGWSVLSGQAKEGLFHGNLIRIAIDAGESQAVYADVQLDGDLHQSRIPQPGSTVRFAVDPQHVTVFADEDS